MDSHQDAIVDARRRAVGQAIQRGDEPLVTTITGLMRHGGLYSLLDKDMMRARLEPFAAGTAPGEITHLIETVQSTAASFFVRLVPNRPYTIPSALMQHIVSPAAVTTSSGTGTTFTDDALEKADPVAFESQDIPAAFTFVGQFVDHDLTMNAVNLFEPQQDPVFPIAPGKAPTPAPIADTASPLIDLDSVYGPRSQLTFPASTLYERDGSFRLERRSTAHGELIDLPRNKSGAAYIADKRNDENQLILQVHLLVMRMHNKFIANGLDFTEARRRTILNWQSVLLTDYLPRIIRSDVLATVLDEIGKPDFGALMHKPLRDLRTGQLRVNMPHEFAIAFRFGHSQLKRAYKLNPESDPSVLFDNSLVSKDASEARFDDLRGSQKLRPEHRIDWSFFLHPDQPVLSNRIDGKVTARAFDLPESTIPDDIKYVGNLPHRNLIRSRQIGLCSGEALAGFYGIGKVAPEAIEPDPTKRSLFLHLDETKSPHGQTPAFETPLWYYILKEAEAENGSGPERSRLGRLGSRLVAEVIVGAIKWAEISLLNEPGFASDIPVVSPYRLLDIATWVGA